MIRVRVILIVFLVCCSIRVQASNSGIKCFRKINAEPISSDDGKVKLTTYTAAERRVMKDDCFELVCQGISSPHRKITWYRLLNGSDNSTGLPIPQYWAHRHYYEYETNTDKDSISSILRIHNFNREYAGIYHCRISNDATTIQSPATYLTLPGPSEILNSPQGPWPLSASLYVMNITAVVINDTSARITWSTSQRNVNANFCKLYQQGTNRRGSFTWKLQVLMWHSFDSLTNNPSYEQINSQKYLVSNDEQYYNRTLTRIQCTDQSYLLTNLSSSFYYKFQVLVEKHKKEDKYVGRSIAKNGSYIYYFSKFTAPRISYPTPLVELCGPFDPNICKASGNPPPLIQLLHPVEQDDNVYKCLAENIHFENSGKKTSHYQIVDFFWNIGSCVSTESPPQPSCVPIQSSGSICSQYISRGSMVYVPVGTNITELYDLAQTVISQLVNDSTHCYNQIVKFICYSYLAPCHANQLMPRRVCPQSCNSLKMECNNQLQMLQLPEWSTALNCSRFKQTEAGSAAECIHISAPPFREELHTDGSCVVGRGTKYTGNFSSPECIAWDDYMQTFYSLSIFTELKLAGSSCRNPGSSGERPWCYTNLTSSISSDRWKYCEVPRCPSCQDVPDVCKPVYDKNDSVYVHDNSYPVDVMYAQCFANTKDRCYQLWNTIVCHLAYPECVKAERTDQLHSFMPLCRSYCHAIKNLTSTCQIPSPCNQSYFIHKLNDIDCFSLVEENCISADGLELEVPVIHPMVNSESSDASNSVLIVGAVAIGVLGIIIIAIILSILIILCYFCKQYKKTGSSANVLVAISNLPAIVYNDMVQHEVVTSNADGVKLAIDPAYPKLSSHSGKREQKKDSICDKLTVEAKPDYPPDRVKKGPDPAYQELSQTKSNVPYQIVTSEQVKMNVDHVLPFPSGKCVQEQDSVLNFDEVKLEVNPDYQKFTYDQAKSPGPKCQELSQAKCDSPYQGATSKQVKVDVDPVYHMLSRCVQEQDSTSACDTVKLEAYSTYQPVISDHIIERPDPACKELSKMMSNLPYQKVTPEQVKMNVDPAYQILSFFPGRCVQVQDSVSDKVRLEANPDCQPITFDQVKNGLETAYQGLSQTMFDSPYQVITPEKVKMDGDPAYQAKLFHSAGSAEDTVSDEVYKIEFQSCDQPVVPYQVNLGPSRAYQNL